MRRDAHQRTPLAHRLADARHVELLEVAQPAVDNLQAVGRSRRPEVFLLDERHLQPSQSSLPGQRCPVDTAPDDENVVFFICHRVQIALHAASCACYELSVRSSERPPGPASRYSRSRSTDALKTSWL